MTSNDAETVIGRRSAEEELLGLLACLESSETLEEGRCGRMDLERHSWLRCRGDGRGSPEAGVVG